MIHQNTVHLEITTCHPNSEQSHKENITKSNIRLQYSQDIQESTDQQA